MPGWDRFSPADLTVRDNMKLRLLLAVALAVQALGIVACSATGVRVSGAPEGDSLASAEEDVNPYDSGPGNPDIEATDEFLDETLADDLEYIPELPGEPPVEATAEDEAAIEGQLGFFGRPDPDLVVYLDGLEIYRGIPPADAKLPEDRIPLVLNHYVDNWILYFTGRGQPYFERWLARLPRWKPIYEECLARHNVPTDLVYLAMIESGFNNRAYSRARAVGPWQFMSTTGRLYGLKVSWWVDDRRDPFRACDAAARHLRDLHDRFGSWYLAAAAYNAGTGKISRALARYNATTFWELLPHRYLARETKNYVPKLIAAMILAKAPERFGFVNIQPEPAFEFETVTVPAATDLEIIARAAGVSYEEIRELNPSLIRWFTPPEHNNYEVRLPKGSSESFHASFERLNKGAQRTFLAHKVRRGESLWHLAYMYNTDMGAIKRLNRIGRYLRAGQVLQIPVRPGTAARELPTQTVNATRLLRERNLDVPAGYEEIVHVVSRGDTLWSIARRFDVTLTDLRRWNAVGRSGQIYPGDAVTVVLPEDRAAAFKDTNKVKIRNDRIDPETAQEVQYSVRRGDTGWGIARKYGVSLQQLSSWNPGVNLGRLRPGDRVLVYVASDDTN